MARILVAACTMAEVHPVTHRIASHLISENQQATNKAAHTLDDVCSLSLSLLSLLFPPCLAALPLGRPSTRILQVSLLRNSHQKLRAARLISALALA